MGSGTPGRTLTTGVPAALMETAPQVGSVAGWPRGAPVGAGNARMVVTGIGSRPPLGRERADVGAPIDAEDSRSPATEVRAGPGAPRDRGVVRDRQGVGLRLPETRRQVGADVAAGQGAERRGDREPPVSARRPERTERAGADRLRLGPSRAAADGLDVAASVAGGPGC